MPDHEKLVVKAITRATPEQCKECLISASIVQGLGWTVLKGLNTVNQAQEILFGKLRNCKGLLKDDGIVSCQSFDNEPIDSEPPDSNLE